MIISNYPSMFDVPNILPIYLCWEQTMSQKVFTEFICDKSKWMMLIFSGIQWRSSHKSNLDLSAWCPKYFESLQPMMTCPPPCSSRLKQLISKKLFFLHILLYDDQLQSIPGSFKTQTFVTSSNQKYFPLDIKLTLLHVKSLCLLQ